MSGDIEELMDEHGIKFILFVMARICLKRIDQVGRSKQEKLILLQVASRLLTVADTFE